MLTDNKINNKLDYAEQVWSYLLLNSLPREWDFELPIAKFRLKFKKVEKTTRPFRYDLNQIPYDYIVEVRNRFKGLDLTHRVHDGLCMKVHDIVQENSYFYLICIGLTQSICVWSKIKVLAYLLSLNIVSSYYGN